MRWRFKLKIEKLKFEIWKIEKLKPIKTNRAKIFLSLLVKFQFSISDSGLREYKGWLYPLKLFLGRNYF